jgi:carboxymethylenebutenolidase
MKQQLVILPLFLMAGCSGQPTATQPEPAGGNRSETVVEAVSYHSGTQVLRGTLYRPAGTHQLPAVVVVHGDFGVTDSERDKARRLADAGFIALVVDLYRGQAVTNVFDAHIMDRAMPEEQVQGDVKAAVDCLAGRQDVRRDAIGIAGWDSGGGYALDAAIHDPRLRAVVIGYGRLVTDPASLAPLQASVLGIFAGQDEGISPETIGQFRAAMKKAGKRLAGVEVFPGCKHGFMNPTSTDAPSPEAARASADAWSKIESFLAAELKR